MDSELENHRLNEDDLSGGTEVRLCGGIPEKGEALRRWSIFIIISMRIRVPVFRFSLWKFFDDACVDPFDDVGVA